MNEDRTVLLERRIRRLELALFSAVAFGIVAVLTGVAMQNDTPKKVRANAFEVVNDKGKLVGSFYATPNGGSIFVSSDNAEVNLGAMEKGATLRMFTPESDLRLTAAFDYSGVLADVAGETTSLEVTKTAGPELSMKRTSGTLRLKHDREPKWIWQGAKTGE
jgi:hypothetical protein